MQDRTRLILFLSILVLTVVVISSWVLPPLNFSVNKVIEIPFGSPTSQIADILADNNLIRSANVFELIVRRQKSGQSLKAGFYQFEKPLTVNQIVGRLEVGLYIKSPVKFVVPEGLTLEQLAELVNKNFPQIRQDYFIKIARSQIGYLFPDTYELPSAISVEQLTKIMRQNFDKQIEPLKLEIEKAEKLGRSLSDVIKMASIVEEEAKTKVDRQIIAGILWKRLDKKMRLEVDVATSTYEIGGLPEVPIANPGLESIKAALAPQSSPYLFYLSDKSGKMHYAKTFAEHKLNIDKYLKK